MATVLEKHLIRLSIMITFVLLSLLFAAASMASATPYTGGGPRSFEEYYPANYSAYVTVGNPNTNSLLSQVTYTDGNPAYYGNIGGKPARLVTGDNAAQNYMYFNLDDTFAAKSKTWIERPAVYLNVWYYDDGTAGDTFFVQYDSNSGGAYKLAGTIVKQGSNLWKNQVIQLKDHKFNNSENAGADFRIGSTTPGKHVYIHQVTALIPPQSHTASSILGTPNVQDKISLDTYTDGTAPTASGLSQSARYVSRDSAATPYMYFDVLNNYAWTAASVRDVRILAEYYDDAAGDLFAVQYSSTSGGSYKETATVVGTGSNTWKVYTIPISDANFNNSQNAGSDFRIVAKKTTGNVNIHRVNVMVTPGQYVKPYTTDFSGSTFQSATDRIVYTTLFYWYDRYSWSHFLDSGKDILTNHPPASILSSYSNFDPAFWQHELTDMIYAGVNIAGLNYWGSQSEMDIWSTVGLPALVTALDTMTAAGQTPPKIGLFLDTNSLGLDYPGYYSRGGPQTGLTTEYELENMYKMIKDFYSMIPPKYWARVDGKVWFNTYDQGFLTPIDFANVFQYVDNRFQQDFGLHLYIAPESTWGYDSSMLHDAHDYWGSANNVKGFGGLDTSIAGVGSAANNTATAVNSAGHPIIIPDPNGDRLTAQLKGALYAGRKMIDLSNWNEMHEGGNLNRTVEDGTRNIDIAHQLLSTLPTYTYDLQGTVYPDAVGGQVATRSTDGNYMWWNLNKTLPAGSYKVFVRAHGYNRNVSLNQTNIDTGATVKTLNGVVNSNDTRYYTLQDYYLGTIDYDGSYNLRLSDWSNGSIQMDEVYLVPTYEGYRYSDLGGTADAKAVGGQAATRSTPGSYVWWGLDKSIYPDNYRVYVRAKGNGKFNLLQVNADTGTTVKSMSAAINSTEYKEYFVGFFSFDGSYNLRLSDYSPAGLSIDTIHLEPHYTNFPMSPQIVWGNYIDDPADSKSLMGHVKAADASGNYTWGPMERRLLPNLYNFYARARGASIAHTFGVYNSDTNVNQYLKTYTADTNNAYADYYAGSFNYNNSYNLLLTDFGSTGGYMDYYAVVPKKDEMLSYLDVGNTIDANPAVVGGKVMTLSSPGVYTWWALGKSMPAGTYSVYVTVKGTGTLNHYQVNEDTSSTVKLVTSTINSPTDYEDHYVMDIDYDGTYNLRLSDYSSAGLSIDMVYIVRKF
ncbi:hypothetical protein [Cohnella soli]|uniref:F5/8 type C domain-containing protein n=1 Tax=Cohnella soli TaxID=425005 RepID=A0ABW0I0C1_9BACL